jgi:hypothetical protein
VHNTPIRTAASNAPSPAGSESPTPSTTSIGTAASSARIAALPLAVASGSIATTWLTRAG